MGYTSRYVPVTVDDLASHVTAAGFNLGYIHNKCKEAWLRRQFYLLHSPRKEITKMGSNVDITNELCSEYNSHHSHHSSGITWSHTYRKSADLKSYSTSSCELPQVEDVDHDLVTRQMPHITALLVDLPESKLNGLRKTPLRRVLETMKADINKIKDQELFKHALRCVDVDWLITGNGCFKTMNNTFIKQKMSWSRVLVILYIFMETVKLLATDEKRNNSTDLKRLCGQLEEVLKKQAASWIAEQGGWSFGCTCGLLLSPSFNQYAIFVGLLILSEIAAQLHPLTICEWYLMERKTH